MKNQRDIELLKEIGNDNHEAFNDLFTFYYPKVKNFLFGFLKNEENSRDLAQDIFVKLWQNRQSLSHIESFQSYLFRMAKNMICNYFEHELIKENYKEKVIKSSINYSDIIEDDIYAEELSIMLDLVVEKMPEQRRRIFKMSRKEGLSNEDIANKLNISKRTVENHMTAALTELRKIVYLALLLLVDM